MKLSVAIAGERALPSAFVVFRGFEESINKAAEMGYNGVELALKSADEIAPAVLRGLLTETGMEVSAISTGQVFADLGLYFTHPETSVRNRCIDVFTQLIHMAAEFGGLVNIGRARGFIAEGRHKAEAMELFMDSMLKLCRAAEPLGVKLMIEPVNRYEINFLNRLDEAAEAARLINQADAEAKKPVVGLMPDVFHMNIEDAGIGKSLIKNSGLIDYIHLADSNRLAPGQGHLNFNEIFGALKQSGFNGWASVEIRPVPDPDTAAKQAADFLLPLINEYNNTKS